MTNYQIKIGAQANADIAETVAYIGQVLQEPRTAGHLYRLIKEEILSLEHMPERYPFEDDDRLRALNIRKLLVKRYKILYLVNRDQREVQIIRMLYAGRDVSKLLEEGGFEEL